MNYEKAGSTVPLQSNAKSQCGGEVVGIFLRSPCLTRSNQLRSATWDGLIGPGRRSTPTNCSSSARTCSGRPLARPMPAASTRRPAKPMAPIFRTSRSATSSSRKKPCSTTSTSAIWLRIRDGDHGVVLAGHVLCGQVRSGLSPGGRWIRTFGPSQKGAAVSASHHPEFVDDHPFRISDWGNSIRSQGIT